MVPSDEEWGGEKLEVPVIYNFIKVAAALLEL
jgi:hypothetical protein